MSKKQLSKGIKTEVGVLTQEQASSLAQTENVASAMFQTGQQLVLAIEQILIQEFHFKDSDLEHLETVLEQMLKDLSHIERNNLLVMSPVAMSVVGELARMKLRNGQGIVFPTTDQQKRLGGK